MIAETNVCRICRREYGKLSLLASSERNVDRGLSLALPLVLRRSAPVSGYGDFVSAGRHLFGEYPQFISTGLQSKAARGISAVV